MSISSSGFTSTTPLTSKGDILSHNGTSTVRIPVGSNGQILIAQSTATIGSSWGTAITQPTGEYLLIGSSYITANTATVSFSSIASSYKALILTGIARSTDSTKTVISVRYNSGTGARSLGYTRYDDGAGNVQTFTVTDQSLVNLDVYGSCVSGNSSGLFGFFRYEFNNFNGGGGKGTSVGFLGATSNRIAITHSYFQTNEINQLSIFHGDNSGASFVSGSKILLFGIK
jgi:hypothetical protein